VYQLLARLPSMGQHIPETWVSFEKILTGLVDRGIIYARVEEVSSLEMFSTNLKRM
jgi:hypothetical protein